MVEGLNKTSKNHVFILIYGETPVSAISEPSICDNVGIQ